MLASCLGFSGIICFFLLLFLKWNAWLNVICWLWGSSLNSKGKVWLLSHKFCVSIALDGLIYSWDGFKGIQFFSINMLFVFPVVVPAFFLLAIFALGSATLVSPWTRTRDVITLWCCLGSIWFPCLHAGRVFLFKRCSVGFRLLCSLKADCALWLEDTFRFHGTCAQVPGHMPLKNSLLLCEELLSQNLDSRKQARKLVWLRYWLVFSVSCHSAALSMVWCVGEPLACHRLQRHSCVSVTIKQEVPWDPGYYLSSFGQTSDVVSQNWTQKHCLILEVLSNPS